MFRIGQYCCPNYDPKVRCRSNPTRRADRLPGGEGAPDGGKN